MPETNPQLSKEINEHTTQALNDKTSGAVPKTFGSIPQAAVHQIPIIDLISAVNSAQALQLVEKTISTLAGHSFKQVELNAGHLLLTRAVLTKINGQLKKHGFTLNAVYSTVPQTQQAALDEGFFVKEAPKKSSVSSMEQLQQQLALARQAQTEITNKQLFSSENLQQVIEQSQQAAISTSPFSVQENEQSPKPAILNEVSAIPVPQDVIDPIFDILPNSETSVPASAANQCPTLLVKGTLRSGQVLRYEGNLVVLGDAHAGSEMTATGDIVVWGELRGIAHAGAGGNISAEIRAMKIEALQLRIADCIARRPDRISYHKPNQNQLPTPEVARILQGEIRVFKESVGIKGS